MDWINKLHTLYIIYDGKEMHNIKRDAFAKHKKRNAFIFFEKNW